VKAALLFALILWLQGMNQAAAQAVVTTGDLEQLSNAIFHARSEISLLRTGDFRLRIQLSETLDAAVATLASVPAGASGPSDPTENQRLQEIRQLVDEVRRRARGPESVSGQGLGPMVIASVVPSSVPPLDVPTGTLTTVSILQALDPATWRPGKMVEAVTTTEVRAGKRLIAPAGSLLRGSVDLAGAHLVFHEILLSYVTYRIWAVPVTSAWTGPLRAGEALLLRFAPPEMTSTQ
jgi:hypothetical protein